MTTLEIVLLFVVINYFITSIHVWYDNDGFYDFLETVILPPIGSLVIVWLFFYYRVKDLKRNMMKKYFGKYWHRMDIYIWYALFGLSDYYVKKKKWVYFPDSGLRLLGKYKLDEEYQKMRKTHKNYRWLQYKLIKSYRKYGKRP